MSFKTFSAVAKQWLQDYFEKYPDRREIIIPKFTSEQLDAEQGDINFKLREDSSQEIIDLMTGAMTGPLIIMLLTFF